MFQSARLKLTGWYLLILIAVSFLFSGVIYRVVVVEMERGFHRAELRLRAREFGIPLPFPGNMKIFVIEDVEDAKRRVLRWLVGINVAILGFSAVASYILAGKTLVPIQEVLEEQRRFVADASHELQTPLTALKTSLEVALRAKKLTAFEVERIMRESLQEVDGLASLNQNLLTLARFERPGAVLPFQRVDLMDVISVVVRRLKPLAAKKGLFLEVAPITQVIEGDEESLTKLLTILLDNAIKYTSSGGRIRVTAKETAGKIAVCVSDTGIGIARKDFPHLFDRFYRADSSRSRETGYGLGLSIARRIVDMHHGTIGFDSKVGRGTTFTIKFPRVT